MGLTITATATLMIELATLFNRSQSVAVAVTVPGIVALVTRVLAGFEMIMQFAKCQSVLPCYEKKTQIRFIKR